MKNKCFIINSKVKPITNYSDTIRIVSLDNSLILDASCFWQIINKKKIILTSNDFFSMNNDRGIFDKVMQNFNEDISKIVLQKIQMSTIYIKLFFSNNIKIFFYTSSTKYESWSLNFKNKQYICIGGGEIVVFNK